MSVITALEEKPENASVGDKSPVKVSANIPSNAVRSTGNRFEKKRYAITPITRRRRAISEVIVIEYADYGLRESGVASRRLSLVRQLL
jgi:hypothetical protein